MGILATMRWRIATAGAQHDLLWPGKDPARSSHPPPWSKFQFAPGPERTFLTTASNQTSFPITLSGKGDSALFDFGQEVGGITEIAFVRKRNLLEGGVDAANAHGKGDGVLSAALAYSESSLYTLNGDASRGSSQTTPDGLISTGPIPTGKSTYTSSFEHTRGGFRYLRIVLETEGSITLESSSSVSVRMTAAPQMSDPSAWANHFYSPEDELLNRIWYACGWTNQLCSVSSSRCRVWPPASPSEHWNNSASCGDGNVILVDGAKRDRMIWPGDMGVSVPALFATLGDIQASLNAVDTLFNFQNPDSGQLPYVGPPIAGEHTPMTYASDTYHLWAIAGTCNVFAFLSSDRRHTWGVDKWEPLTHALNTSIGKINSSSGLMVVTATSDWARHGQGGQNMAANSLLFNAMRCVSEVGTTLGGEARVKLAKHYSALANTLADAIDLKLWDEDKGAYRDNADETGPPYLYPQDGNSIAVWLNVTQGNIRKNQLISDYLQSNWNDFGSTTPEWGGDIGTFPASMEVHAHMVAGQAARAHDLIRLQWGHMLTAPESTGSSFWEGYKKDGTFAYGGPYMSNAHGWATGAASALTQFTVGVRVFANGNFLVEPHFGRLRECSGKMAGVEVQWKVSGSPLKHSGGDSTSMRKNSSATVEISVVLDKGLQTLRQSSGSIRLDTKHLFDMLKAHEADLIIDQVHVAGVLAWSRATDARSVKGFNKIFADGNKLTLHGTSRGAAVAEFVLSRRAIGVNMRIKVLQISRPRTRPDIPE